jgi:hypothetical protein
MKKKREFNCIVHQLYEYKWTSVCIYLHKLTSPTCIYAITKLTLDFMYNVQVFFVHLCTFPIHA